MSFFPSNKEHFIQILGGLLPNWTLQAQNVLLDLSKWKISDITSDKLNLLITRNKISCYEIYLLDEAFQIWRLEYAKTRHLKWFCDE